MSFTLSPNLTTEQLSWAEPRWKAALDNKQTEAQSVDEWIWALFGPGLQSKFDQDVLAAVVSWKPEETAEVSGRRDDVVQQILAVPEAKLLQLEQILTVTLDDSDEVAKRRSEAVQKLIEASEEKLAQIEVAISADVKVIDPIEIDPVPVDLIDPIKPVDVTPAEEVKPVDPAPVDVNPVEEAVVNEKPILPEG